MSNPIKVAVVEDSAVARKLLENLINSSDEAQVVGSASDGVSGLKLIQQTQPDVVCTDLQMPNMDGLELTKAIMSETPRPILVVSNFVGANDVNNVFELMQAGAADFFQKPSSDTTGGYEDAKSSLVGKIKVLASKA